MTKSLLGPYIQRVPDVYAMREWLFYVRPNVVLTMENSTCEAILGDRPPDWNPIVIGRKHMGQELGDPRAVARSIVDSQWRELCEAGIVTHMMLKNEITPHHGRWKEYVGWERTALDELAWYDIKYAAGSWSVGQPDELYYRCTTATCGFSCAYAPDALCPNCGAPLEKRIVYYDDAEVHQLMRRGAASGAILKLHQYNAPSMADGRDFDPPITNPWDPIINSSWRILRHRKAYSQLLDFLSPEEIPGFVIGECGLEAGAVPWPIKGIREGELAGWKTMCSVEEYMESLRWFDWQCRHDPYVKGLVVFIMGTYQRQSDGSEGDWVTHDVWPIREQFAEVILNPLPIEEEPEPEPPDPEPEPTDALEEWIKNEVEDGWANELAFVPENFIESLGLHMGWIPVSDEEGFGPPSDLSDKEVWVKVFVAPVLTGGYCKVIVWWYPDDWENYKVITVSM